MNQFNNLNFKHFKRKRRGKKGQLIPIVAVIVTIFTIALTLILGKHIFYEVDTALETGGLHTNESRQSMQDMAISFSIFDGAMVFILIGLTIGLIMSSFFIQAHPVFLVINIVGLVFLVFIGAMLSNLYGDITLVEPINNSIVAYGSDFDKTDFVMFKLPYICAMLVLISTIVMYAKSKG